MSSYLRYPHVHNDVITFVADNDVWLADLGGGRASRLTNDHVPVRSPFFSPDGSRIAFASSVGGGFDLYVHSDDGVVRLTWWSDRLLTVSGWLDDEHVLICAEYGTAQRALTYLYSVSLGGEVARLPYGPAMSVAFGPGGAVAVNTPNFRDAAAWKRYRGGMASQLWLDRAGKGRWSRVLPAEAASLYQPGWFGDRLIFWSDLGARLPENPREQAQLYSVAADGSDLCQHTRHGFDEGYVRNPTTDGTTIVYHARGVLYRMAGLDAAPEAIDVSLGLGAPRPVRIAPTDRLQAIVPDHGCDGSLLEWRGAAYYLTHRSGPARALSDLPGVRIREPQLLGRTGRGIWATDAEGDDALEIMPLDADGDPVRLAGGKLGRVLHLASNPEGTQVAVGSHDGRVLVVDVATGAVREVGRSAEGEPTGLTFSPDGRYLVWRGAVGAEGEVGQLMCIDLSAKKSSPVALTKGQFNDFSPVFSSDGRYLMFLSGRTLDPSYDDQTFDLGFRGSVRPWIAPLSAEDPAPFGPAADGWPLSAPESDDDKASDDEPKKKDAQACLFDMDGFEDRLVAFPVPSGEYQALRAAKDGAVWLHGVPKGALGSARAGVDGDEPKSAVEHFGFGTRKLAVVAERADSFAVSGDGARIVVREGDNLWVQSAHEKPAQDDDAKVSIDLARLRRDVWPRDEWRQMFDENGRIMAQHFWRADMGGVDWVGVLGAYRPIVERLASHDDLVDLLWEVVGELNTSHSYVVPVAGNQPLRVGFLGAAVGRSPKGEFVIDEVLPGESSDPAARSPLRAAGVGAKPGDVIVAVDGRPVVDAPALGALLQGGADRVVEVTLAQRRMKRRVAVVPIADEKPLRYHQWVASRVAYVDEKSAGRLGYVHIPNMMSEGWAEFHRLIERASQRDGVIVDVRFNGGGHTSQLVLERISRKVLGWGWARQMDTAMPYPSQAMRGPVIVVTNAYAGSDGDIISAAVQTAGLGPVIGQRSWGGVVGIDGRFDLVDGTRITQPRYACAFTKHGFAVENHGVDPDIVVAWGPAEWESDTDSQLDKAIDEAFKRLKKTPAATPPDFEPPKFA